MLKTRLHRHSSRQSLKSGTSEYNVTDCDMRWITSYFWVIKLMVAVMNDTNLWSLHCDSGSSSLYRVPVRRDYNILFKGILSHKSYQLYSGLPLDWIFKSILTYSWQITWRNNCLVHIISQKAVIFCICGSVLVCVFILRY